MSRGAPFAPFPVAPRPECDERLSSWLQRLAGIYAMPTGMFLDCCGLSDRRAAELEWRLGTGAEIMLAARTRMTLPALRAMTFEDIAPHARSTIARGSRYLCPECSRGAFVHRKAAALPWTFWCAAHQARFRSAGGQTLEALLPGKSLAELDPDARRGAARLDAWARGRDERLPALAVFLDFLTARHRRRRPPSLDEQQRSSLQAGGVDHELFSRPIVRQALLVVVPEYDHAAQLPAQPLRSGFAALAHGSLLTNYALAVGLGRLDEHPVDCATAVLAASDWEGEERVRVALQAWPPELRRSVDARFRRFRATQAAARFTASRMHDAGKNRQSHKLRFAQSHKLCSGIS